MLKVLLIHPFYTCALPDRAYPAEPLGLLSIATYLLQEAKEASLDVDVKIVDAQMLGPEQTVKTDNGYRSGMRDDELELLVNEYKPNVIGIANNYTNGLSNVLQMAQLFKQISPDSFLVIGGAHATIDHLELVKLPEIDAVVRSEGEETFKELVFALCRGDSLEGVKGLTHECNGKIIKEDDRELIEDVNLLPIPNRSLLKYTQYLDPSKPIYSMTQNFPVATIFTSRGCPYKCIFCSTQHVWRNKWRARSAAKVLEEIKYLKDEYGVKEFAFQDDQLIGDKKRMKDLCRLLIKERMNVSLIAPPGISPALLDDETLRLMRKAGFYRVCLSIDVGSKKAQTFVRKPVNLDKMRSVVKKANSVGLWTYATFVIGFPNETTEDVKETIKYAYNLKLDHLIFYIAQPHMGSELYEMYLADGIIDREDVNRHHLPVESLYGTKNITAEELERLRDSAAGDYMRHHFRHFFNPVYVALEFMPKLLGIQKFLYFIRIMINLKNFAPLMPPSEDDESLCDE